MTIEEIIDFCEMKAQLEPENEDIFNYIIKTLEIEPCENCCNGNQIEKAKLCQKSYLAGMGHKQEPCEDAILNKIRAEIDIARFIDKDTKLCKNANGKWFRGSLTDN